jgi:DNA-directed RNA polymerase subunit L
MEAFQIIEVEKYHNKKFEDTHLILEFNNLNYTFINSLRKVAICQVPIYAFDVNNIKIINNTSIYNNSQVALRLSQLPIPNINHDIDFLEYKYYVGEIKEKHPKDTFDIDYYLKVSNIGDELTKYGTTNDLKVNINHEEIKYNDMNPILLIKLRQGEEIELSMKATLSIGEINSIYNASSCYYDEIDENKILFTIKSNRQLKEYDILIKSCDIIIIKMNNFKELVKKHNDSKIENDKMFIMNIDNEDYTLLNPINYVLQKSKDVQFCGIAKYNGFLDKNIRLKIKTNNNKSPLDEIEKAINKSIDIFEDIKSKIIQLSKEKSKKDVKEEIPVKKTVKKNKK